MDLTVKQVGGLLAVIRKEKQVEFYTSLATQAAFNGAKLPSLETFLEKHSGDTVGSDRPTDMTSLAMRELDRRQKEYQLKKG